MSPILVADDDAVGLELVSRLLRKAGHDVVTSSDGERAWEMIQTFTPRLVVLDWNMPKLDGLEILRRLRLRFERTPPYVILLTSHSKVKDRVRGLTQGADDYLVKPFDPAELGARVQVGLRIVHLQHTLSARVDELEQALTRVHGLEQLLPICAHCKRIRAAHGGWETLEGFLGANAGVRFSHGACPGCASRWVDEPDAVTPQG
jgi:sigma-B regulation protein RsbU (phosphoserine phosphatase)